jgi:hypothetical protein
LFDKITGILGSIARHFRYAAPKSLTAQNQIPTINPRLSLLNTPTNFSKKTLVKFFTIWQFLPASGQESV